MQTPALRLALAIIVLTSAACGDRGAAATKASTAERNNARAQLKAQTQSAQPAPAPPQSGQAAKSDSGPSFERMAGYVVRGSDESSFRRCGSNQTHFVRVRGEAAVHVTQRYRFKAPVPLSPVYFVFRARVIGDTVVVGDYTYTSVLDVRSVFPDQAGSEPDCPAPMRGSMIAQR